jgi:hypothetical protein
MDPTGVELGGGVTLSHAIELLQKASEMDGYSYTAQMSKHLKRVANTPVRNVIVDSIMIENVIGKQSDRFAAILCLGSNAGWKSYGKTCP